MSNASHVPAGGAKRDAASARARRKRWYAIAFVAIGTLLFFVLGTIDPSTRYDLIGL